MNRKADIRAKSEARAVEAARRYGLGCWIQEARYVLTAAEQDEVAALWARMPGSCCWADALREWLRLP